MWLAMSSIQFNYFSDEIGEQIIKEELIKRFGSLYQRDYLGDKTKTVLKIDDLKVESFSTYLTDEKLTNELSNLSGKTSINVRESPIIEYVPSKLRDDDVYIEGRLAYFAGNNFPEFKREVQALFRKLKKYCWKDKQWQSWVFDSIGNEATAYISNKVVHLKKE